MKNRTRKRLLAGCLAVLLTFSDASGVLAEEMSERTEVVVETEPAESTETVAETEVVESTEAVTETEVVEVTETVIETEVVEATGAVIKTEVESFATADYDSNLLTAPVSNLTYEFLDIDDNMASTANATENTIRFVVFEMGSCQLGLAFTEYDYDEYFASEQFQFTWLCRGIESAEAFAADTYEETTSLIHYLENNEDEKIRAMRDHIEICVDGENLTTDGETSVSNIQTAYDAYWEAAGLTEAGVTYYDDWNMIYAVNDENQIVGAYLYRGETYILTTILEDVKNYITSNLAPVENLTVTADELGGGSLSYTHPALADVSGFNIYVSVDGGNTYTYETTRRVDTFDQAEPEAAIYTGVNIPLDATGNNGDCMFKVVPYDVNGLEGTGATVSFVGTTVNQYQQENSWFVDICFVDESGAPISALDLHVGEAKKIGLALITSDGSLVHMNDYPFHIYQDPYVYGQFEIDWSIRKAPIGNTSEENMETAEWAECLDLLATKEIIEAKEAYFTATAMAETGYTHFIEVRVTCFRDFGTFWLRLPVNVLEAEEGAVYEQPEAVKVVTTAEEVAQGIRDLMVARDYEGVVLATTGMPYFDPWTDLMDLYGEREGMAPYEGDYLNFTIGERDAVSVIYSHYEEGYISYKGESYVTYKMAAPFITTREEEDAVDAKIYELVHTEGGELYIGKYGTDEEKVRAIYDYIVKHVNPQVPGNRTTPIYHTAYHALFGAYGGYEGSGTCQAFAMLFTRLSREMGIPSKVIMGVDAAAHAYNIVELDGQWYYIDTNTRRYLSGSDTFNRAEEQYYYKEQAYVDNYLSKVSEREYGFVYGATLSYTDETGNVVVNEVADFAEAVAKINSLKTKRDYTITINDTYLTTKAIAMPNKNYVATLTIEGAGDYMEVFYNGNITLTSPTVLKNLYFKKSGAIGNAAPITFSTGGHALTVDGKVYFNTPVNFNGGKKGILEITDAGRLYTITNGNELSADTKEQLVCGGITNFAEVIVNAGQILTTETLNVTTLTNAGDVLVSGTVKLTNANLNNGYLYSDGTIQIANMKLEGEVVVSAEKDFKVTGNIISATDKATFYTKLNAKNVPYLNITGTVTLENRSNKIQVGVYAADGDQLVKLETGDMLLNAKTATADMFAPVANNVGNVAAYPAEGGYFLQKTKTAIYVHYADEIGVALCEGSADTGNLEDAVVLGYFATFADAVAAIEARKDTTAEYTIILLKDVNSESAPAAITMPSKAKNVVITGVDGEVYDIYYTGNITLKASTEFVKVRFNPMNAKKQGAASKIAAGKFNLTLRDIEVGSKSGMTIKDISGSASQVTTFATAGLNISGNVLNSKEIVIEKPLTVKGNIKATTVTIENGTSASDGDKNKLVVGGTFTATNLVLQGYALLDVAGAITVTNIYNNTTVNIDGTQANGIYYTKSSKGTPNLTVKGLVSGDNETKVELHYDLTGVGKSDYELVMKSNKFTLDNKKALATVEKAALSEMTFYLGATKLGGEEVVKANKGVYILDVSSNANVVLLQHFMNGVTTSSYCLDFSQAVNEINNIGEATAGYLISIGILPKAESASDVTDTNLTDNKAVSPITMPKKGKAEVLTISSDEGESIAFSGNISFTGDLMIHNVVLKPEKDCNLTGTKNVSGVFLSNASVTFKNISNVNQLILDNADMVTTGTVTVPHVILSGESHWDALAKTTVTNLDASGMATGSYVASKQTANTLVPMFTISGRVILNETGTPVAWKVLQPTATVNDLNEVPAYKGVGLVVAPKESADKFIAYPFADADTTNDEGIAAANLIAYKTIKNEVASGDETEMVIRLVQTHEGVSGEAETYAKSFDEAVTIINNLADTTASYRMELLQGSDKNPILTTKNGTVLGKMTLPTKAAEVTIVGANSTEKVAIAYTGSLAINCDTVFDNVALYENNVINNVSVSYKGAYELTFTDNVDSDAGYAILYLQSVNIPKGKLTLDNARVYTMGITTIKDLETTGESMLETSGKTTITNISGTGSGNNGATLMLNYCFTTKNATQLAINGNISNVELELVPNLYNPETEEYDFVTIGNIASKQLVTMPKASTTGITLQYLDNAGEWQTLTGGKLYKQNGGLYYGAEAPVVEVVAEDAAENEVYASQFLTWEQAVKEIDKRADASLTYRMILKDNIGGAIGSEEPVKTLTLPAKVKEVIVTSEAGEENHIFFLGTKITLKANTTFENVGLFALKKVAASLGNGYNSVGYTLAAGKYNLHIEDLQAAESEVYSSSISAITGAAKGALTVVLGSAEKNNLFVIDKISGFGTVNIYNEEQDDAIVENQVETVGLVTKGMSGIGTLNVYPGVILSSDSGTIVAKNANICGGAILAKDVTVSQTATLESAIIMAGSEAATDGKLKLNNIIVEDTENYLSAKVDKKGKSQLNITGTVTASKYYMGTEGESAIVVDLYSNDYSSHVQLFEGMILMTAAKADTFWFVPCYTFYDAVADETIDGMGYYIDGCGLYKAGKEIKYGSVGM